MSEYKKTNLDQTGSHLRNRSKLVNFLFLQLTFVIYSFCGILSKMASGVAFLSLQFILLYGGVIGILMIYAVLWQQVLKRFSLNFAYVNKSVIIIWGMVWGVVFFQEKVTLLMFVGSIIVLIGITLAAQTYE